MGQFDDYREEIQEMITRRMNNASILRALRQNYPDVNFGQTQFYPYCNSLRAAQSENSTASNSVSGFDPGLQAFLTTLPEKLDQLWETQGKIQRAIMETDQETKLRFQQLEQTLNSRARTAAPPPARPSKPYIPSLPNIPRPRWHFRFRLRVVRKRTFFIVLVFMLALSQWRAIYPYVPKNPYTYAVFYWIDRLTSAAPLSGLVGGRR